MASENTIKDAPGNEVSLLNIPKTDEELKKCYGINDCFVNLHRMSNSIVPPSEISYIDLPRYESSLFRGISHFSDTESDTWSSTSESSSLCNMTGYIVNSSKQTGETEKPFSIHYCPSYLDEIVRNIYTFNVFDIRINLSDVFKYLHSEHVTLSEQTFKSIVRTKLESYFYRAINEELKAEFRIATESVLKKIVTARVNAVIGSEDNPEPSMVKIPSKNCLRRILNNSIHALKNHRRYYRKLFYDETNFVLIREDTVKLARRALKRAFKLKIKIRKEEYNLATQHFQKSASLKKQKIAL